MSDIVITHWQKTSELLPDHMFSDSKDLHSALESRMQQLNIDVLYTDRNICISRGGLYYGAFFLEDLEVDS